MAKTSSGSGRQGFDPYKPSAGTDTWTQEMLDAYLASGAGGAEVFSPPEPPSTVEEERDIELANTPNEKVAPVSAVTTDAGAGLNGPKKQYPLAANPSDNPIEEDLWTAYETMVDEVKKATNED